jgi:excinuclease ABC subunit C
MAEIELRGALRDQLSRLPDAPGVYVYHDAGDEVLYVGKAKSLRKRVRSYFQSPVGPESGPGAADTPGPKTGLHPKIAEMVSRIERLEFIVTGSETEALILEGNLVKAHRPPFNIRLRDDKSYPYIAISLDETYPRVYFTRERHRRDRRYFGPFSNASNVRETLNLIGKIFPSRPCEGPEPGRPSGIPCLDFHIKRCLAPCVDYISRADYRDLIDKTIAFLTGEYRGLERALEAEMARHATGQDYEQAAVARDRLNAVRHLMQRQWASNEAVGTLDVLGVAVEDDAANVQVLQVRDGVMQDRQSFFLESPGVEDIGEVVAGFLQEYYSLGLAIPPLIAMPAGVDAALLSALLSERRGARVEVRVPERGDKRKLVEMAQRNAHLALDQERRRLERARSRRREALDDLQKAIGLDVPPFRIECYDISNLGATYSVGSMVVAEGGAPKRDHYRTFTTRYDGGPDDFARMNEVLGRRLARLADADDPSFASRPGLIVIDGGKGQLSAAQEALAQAGVGTIPMIGLAKRLEEVFLPGRSTPVILPERSAGLRLLQQVRDEAHRFALRHHRSQRGKGMTASIFDSLPGVGPKRRQALIRHFGSADAVLAASREEISAVPGLPSKLARDIHEQLNKTAGPEKVRAWS